MELVSAEAIMAIFCYSMPNYTHPNYLGSTGTHHPEQPRLLDATPGAYRTQGLSLQPFPPHSL